MKKLGFIILAASLLTGTAAYSQSVGIGIGPGGAGVRIDDGRDRGYRRDGRDYRRDREIRRSRNETVIIQRPRRDRDWDRRRGPKRVYIVR